MSTCLSYPWPTFPASSSILTLLGVVACAGGVPGASSASTRKHGLPTPTARLEMTAGQVFQGEAPNAREVEEIILRLEQRLASANIHGSRACRITGPDDRQGFAYVTPAYPIDATGTPQPSAASWDIAAALGAARDSSGADSLLAKGVEARRLWMFLVHLGDSGVASESTGLEAITLRPDECAPTLRLDDTPLLPPSAPLLVVSYEFRRTAGRAGFVGPNDPSARPISDQFAAAGLWQVAPPH